MATRCISEQINVKRSELYKDYDEYVSIIRYLDLDRRDFCCGELHNNLLGERDGRCELWFDYDPIMRSYALVVRPEYGGSVCLINYCPWCGKKFPKELLNEFIEALKEELNIKDSDVGLGELKKRADIPQEFRSDEWWKKRGL